MIGVATHGVVHQGAAWQSLGFAALPRQPDMGILVLTAAVLLGRPQHHPLPVDVAHHPLLHSSTLGVLAHVEAIEVDRVRVRAPVPPEDLHGLAGVNQADRH